MIKREQVLIARGTLLLRGGCQECHLGQVDVADEEGSRDREEERGRVDLSAIRSIDRSAD